jgi:hypothetical protein
VAGYGSIVRDDASRKLYGEMFVSRSRKKAADTFTPKIFPV